MAEHKGFKITLRLGVTEKGVLDRLAQEEERSRNTIIRRLLLSARMRPDIIAAVEKAILSAFSGRGEGEDHGKES